MTHRQQPHRWLHNTFSTPLEPAPALLSQGEMVARILAVRGEPMRRAFCPACGSRLTIQVSIGREPSWQS